MIFKLLIRFILIQLRGKKILCSQQEFVLIIGA